MEILVKRRNGSPYINGKRCSFETKKIRKFVFEMIEVNKSFVLPKKYTYEITKLNGFAKIIKKLKKNLFLKCGCCGHINPFTPDCEKCDNKL